jgi:hypothetical protein
VPKEAEREPWDDDDVEPWCKDFDRHRAAHEFCADHQAFWCRLCDKGCASCEDDPRCPECHCSLFTDYHNWDCGYADDE